MSDSDYPLVPPVSNIFVSHTDLYKGVRKVLKEFFSSWSNKYIEITRLENGLTNKIFKCEVKGAETPILIRVYGKKTEALINRDQELTVIASLGTLSLGPTLHGIFENGYCYDYLKGIPLVPEDLKDPHIKTLIAKYLRNWHKSTILGISVEPSLWSTLNKRLLLIPDKFSCFENDKRFKEMTSKEWIKKELNSLKEFLDQTNAPVVFAHNDLLPANILYDKEEDHVWFIDYEYASYNYRGFDIGNHFCEFAGTRSPLQWEAYPSKAEQMEFLRAYLGEPNTCQFSHVGGETDAEHELERLYVEANQFSLAAHLFWGTWAFVQSETSDIDYDYMGYGLARLGEYLNRKHEFLSLQLT